jgi:hypothetical protein
MKDKNLDFVEQNEKFILKFNKFFRIIITVPSYLGGVFWEKEQCFARAMVLSTFLLYRKLRVFQTKEKHTFIERMLEE